MKKIDLVGQKFGRLEVIAEHPERKMDNMRGNAFVSVVELL